MKTRRFDPTKPRPPLPWDGQPVARRTLPITAVCCVYDRSCYEEHALPWLRAVSDDVVEVGARYSIFEAYNRGRMLARHREILYVHEDVRCLDVDGLYRQMRWFLDRGDVGLVGALGAASLATVPWWHNPSVGGVMQGSMRTASLFGQRIDEPLPAESLDGMFLLTRLDYRWPEEHYTGWHFYDAEISIEAHRSPLSTWVLPIRLHHVCRDKSREILPDFQQSAAMFSSRWGIPFSAEKYWLRTDPTIQRELGTNPEPESTRVD